MKVYKYLKGISKMNAREFLDLQDAYQDVYQELGEAMVDGPRKDKMIAKQHSPYVSSRDRANAFNIGVRDDRPRDKKSTGGKGERYSDFGDRGAGNKSRRRRGLEPIHGNTRKEEVDLYDLILSHLLDEGYADTEESASAIMANMSEDWKESICEEVLDEEKKEFPSDKAKKQSARHMRNYLTKSSSYVGQRSRKKSAKMDAIRSTVEVGDDPRNTMHGQDLRKI